MSELSHQLLSIKKGPGERFWYCLCGLLCGLESRQDAVEHFGWHLEALPGCSERKRSPHCKHHPE